jgi:hypothetical protein
VPALVPALREWFVQPPFRGCAFINTVAELGDTQPEALAIARRHKDAMRNAIAALLPASRTRRRQAQALALAVDGAILRAQLDGAPTAALRGLGDLLQAWQASAA